MNAAIMRECELITPKMAPYMRVISDTVENLVLDKQIQEWTQKPMFIPTIELLSECIDVVQNKPENILEKKDLIKAVDVLESKEISFYELADMLQIVDFFEIKLLEKVILIHLVELIPGSDLSNSDEHIKYISNSIPQYYKDILKRLLYDYYIGNISYNGNYLRICIFDEWNDNMEAITNTPEEDTIEEEHLFDIYSLLEDIIAPKANKICLLKEEIKELQRAIIDFIIIISVFDQVNQDQ